MKKYLIPILSCLVLFISCKEEKKEKAPTQMEQVMAIHDEVMPKMGQLGKLVGQLKPMADSLGADSPEAKAMRDLQDANKAMMDWMQNFGNRFEPEEIMEGKELSEEKKQWLDEEEVEVKEVKEKINSSIANAEALLEKAN
ncbi:hypothetical protein [Maribacter cobaltidurans]|uniref:Uncharacterized protein n=1 Tax=Maribacter cobaltidurans TaxID=1178778 RepID=A0A223V5T3_9FLAO|nr:hypothetical protein [Maribacter cobaltidurans]ASV30470.1 hypothetical protein CJ263_09740 [Maribacter cobaltidurans]GGD78970.1 hypothetical protein GCM10011412_15980 [Maribacter cobaltidurans]